MENANFNDVIGCGNINCHYTSSLALNNSYTSNYYSKWCTSLPNYLVLLGGSDAGYSMGCNSCDPLTCGNLWPIANQTLVDRVEGTGRTWKAYMEDYPSSGTGKSYSAGGCYLGSTLNYEAIHNPFIYYKGIENSTARCSKIVRANTFNVTNAPETDDLLLNDLQSTATASNFMWLTPNNCDNMHDTNLCFSGNRIANGEAYLNQLIPAILSTPVFTTQKAALFITWDEGTSQSALEQVGAIWAGSPVKTHYCNCSTINPSYSHASFPRTLEAVWGLSSLNMLDATAPAMTEFFV